MSAPDGPRHPGDANESVSSHESAPRPPLSPPRASQSVPRDLLTHPETSDGATPASAAGDERSNGGAAAAAPAPAAPMAEDDGRTIYDFQVLDCYHELYDLAQHKGHPLLIVNVASRCKEYTLTCYTMLNALYAKYKDQGFTVLAFPCNQFGQTEPDPEEEIAEVLSSLYPTLGDVEFPIMAKIDVNGDRESPLYTFLKSRLKGTLGQSAIKWTFTSFLVDQRGVPVARFPSDCRQADVEEKLEALLRGDVLEPADAVSARPSALPDAVAGERQESS